MRTLHSLATLTIVFALAACTSGGPTLPSQVGFGPNPVLPPPRPTGLIPVVNIAPAVGWTDGQIPRAAPGFRVAAFARGLDHPRWVYVLPNGDVLVAETNRPPKPTKGLRAFFMGIAQGRAGAGTPSANRITLLRDADGDGVAETRTAFLENLYSPFGMTLVGNDFYVANADGVVRFPYTPGATSITALPMRIAALPGGPNNHHWTKNVIASRDGTRLYATVGSNSNVAENGMQEEEGRAAIWEIDRASGRARVFAFGLRNPNGMDFEPQTGALWTVVNERDEIGNDLVPDYMTSVQDGGFYGWPFSYYGQTVDTRARPQRPDLVARAIKPDYALGAHTAALGLTFYNADALPQRYRGGAFVGLHGSWNRAVANGYKVIFVPFANGRPSGPPEDVLTGFLDEGENAYGRPVGVTVDRSGALLVADDVGNVIWRLTAAPLPVASAP
jgi:glucose/arabinose dehydrogenase